MPSFNALAGAALTPGGVASGLSDLTAAFVQVPQERRRLELAQAAQQAMAARAQQDYDLRAAGQAQDQKQFEQNQQRQAMEAILRFQGGRKAGSMTMEDALRLTPKTELVNNPSFDPNNPAMGPQRVRQAVKPQDRIDQANQYMGKSPFANHGPIPNDMQPMGSAGSPFIPADKVLGQPHTDPQSKAVMEALLGLSAMAGMQPGGAAPSVEISPAGAAPGEASQPAPAQPGNKVATLAEVQQQAQQAGWSVQEAVEYYRSQGYTIQ